MALCALDSDWFQSYFSQKLGVINSSETCNADIVNIYQTKQSKTMVTPLYRAHPLSTYQWGLSSNSAWSLRQLDPTLFIV